MNAALDPAQADAALVLDPAWIAELRSLWLDLMETAVWDDPAMQRLGDAPRLRKRLLELGERLKNLGADRGWIPHPRARLKSALAIAAGVRESLTAAEGLLAGLAPGPVADRLREQFADLRIKVETMLPDHENAWAALLDAQLGG
ncbi:MAG: hypothetical protein Q8M53_16435 [Burkholderiales bacterium]|nr:hypothetical protein [Burkholderiales bacterium]